MVVMLLDNSLKVEIYYDECDRDFADSICVSFREECPDDERIFRGDETNIYLTPEQAMQLAQALSHAASACRNDQDIQE